MGWSAVGCRAERVFVGRELELEGLALECARGSVVGRGLAELWVEATRQGWRQRSRAAEEIPEMLGACLKIDF
jgi:hypothetical protein